MTPIALLQSALILLSNPANWRKGNYSGEGPSGPSYDVVGACAHVSGVTPAIFESQANAAYMALFKAAGNRTPSSYNDAIEHGRMLVWVGDAIGLLEAEA